MEQQHNHSGHRQRIKNKVKKFGICQLEQHEILEVLLTYSIPRKDTNGLAHNLLNNFGSLVNVIDAEPSQLKSVVGVGDETALFFNILKDVSLLYLEQKRESKTINLNTTEKCVEFFKQHFLIENNECFYGLCLNKSGKYLYHFVVKGESERKIEFPAKIIIDNISTNNVKQLVIIHTHPDGDINPSTEDFVATDRINGICTLLGVEFNDHIILNSDSNFSFKTNSLINKITVKQAETKVARLKYIIDKED